MCQQPLGLPSAQGKNFKVFSASTTTTSSSSVPAPSRPHTADFHAHSAPKVAPNPFHFLQHPTGALRAASFPGCHWERWPSSGWRRAPTHPCTHRLGRGQVGLVVFVFFFLLSFYFNSRTLLHTKCNCRNNCRVQSVADKWYSGSKLGNHRIFVFSFFSFFFFWVKFKLCCMVGTFIIFNTFFFFFLFFK